jgi:hypothetical protein
MGNNGNIFDALTADQDLVWIAAQRFGGSPVKYCDLVGVDETQASGEFLVELETDPVLPPENMLAIW